MCWCDLRARYSTYLEHLHFALSLKTSTASVNGIAQMRSSICSVSKQSVRPECRPYADGNQTDAPVLHSRQESETAVVMAPAKFVRSTSGWTGQGPKFRLS